MNGKLKPRVINTNPRVCPKPATPAPVIAPTVIKTVVVEPVITDGPQRLEVETPKKKTYKPQSGKVND